MRLALLALAGAACASSGALLADADADLRERDFERALDRYRSLKNRECSGGDAALCCRGMLGEGEALLALGERQAAIKTLERCRSQCPRDLDVRRKLYLAEHPADPETPAPTGRASFVVEHDLGRLGERPKITWLGLFLDGELMGREPHAVAPGNHDLEADGFVDVPGPEGRRPVRLRARAPVVAPRSEPSARLVGTIRVSLGERQDATLPEDRITFQMEAVALTPAEKAKPETPDDPGTTAPKMLGHLLTQHLGLALRVSGARPKVPPELMRRGEGWKIQTEICVATDGRPDTIRFLEPSPAHDPRVDAAVLDTLRRWRYGAYRVNGVLQRFCHPLAVDLGGRDLR